jgi:hypothetical protein
LAQVVPLDQGEMANDIKRYQTTEPRRREP